MSRQVQGLQPWVWQRVSALYLALFLIYCVISFLYMSQFNYQDWISWVTAPVSSVFIYLGILMLFAHAWVGIRDVIMDYVHPLVLRSSVIILAGFGLMACLLWLSRILILAILK